MNTTTPFRATSLLLLRSPARGMPGSEGLAAPGAELDRAGYLSLLGRAASDEGLVEALRVASPSLADLVTAVSAAGGTTSKKTAQLRRAALAVIRYDLRRRSRPTPFGLFAGVALAQTAPTAKVAWDRADETRTRVELDWLLGLIRSLETDPELLRHVRLRTHSALCFRGSRVLLATPANLGVVQGEDGRGEVSVRHTPAVDAALQLARDGMPGAELIQALGDRFPRAGAEEISWLVRSLVDHELLISELRPPLDGTDPLTRTIEVLSGVEERTGDEPALLKPLREVAGARSRYDHGPSGHRLERLNELERRMRELRRTDKLVHVDLKLGADVRVPQEVADEAAAAARVMWRLAPPELGLPWLRAYRSEFLERYGMDRLVPVPELLDECAGLGAPAGYKWPESLRADDDVRLTVDAERDRLLMRLAAAAARDGVPEIALDEDLLARLEPVKPDPRFAPSSCELYFTLVADSAEDLSAGRFQLVIGPNPGSGEAGSTFGRFASQLGIKATDVVPRPDGGTEPEVTIAFQPRNARAANVGHGPCRSEHRVSIGLPPDPAVTEIRPEEIGVGATLDRFYAVHLPTGRHLRPVAYHVVDLSAQAPNIARFLIEIGHENRRLLAPWRWGHGTGAPVLPRVRHGRTILAPATWTLDEPRENTDAGRWPGALDRWRSQWSVPRHIIVTSSDQRLSLDLDNVWHREMLRDEVRKDQELVAQESPGQSGWLRDAQGVPRLAELVVPLVRADRPSLVEPRHRRPAAPSTPSARLTLPGGDWLYTKLYLPGRHTDAFLADHLRPFLAGSGAAVDRWFFLRYRDTEDHIRLRFHGPAAALWGELLTQLRSAAAGWFDARLISGFTLDAYEPEWERYGGPALLPLAEELFCADSQAALAMLALTRSGTGPAELDMPALAAIALASLADAYGLPAESPGDDPLFAAAHEEGDAAALWLSGAATRNDVPADFRSRRDDWLRLIDPAGGWAELRRTTAGETVLRALAKRAERARAYGQEVRRLAVEDELPTPEGAIVSSLMHMTCNRFLGMDPDQERQARGLARACVVGGFERRRRQR